METRELKLHRCTSSYPFASKDTPTLSLLYKVILFERAKRSTKCIARKDKNGDTGYKTYDAKRKAEKEHAGIEWGTTPIERERMRAGA